MNNEICYKTFRISAGMTVNLIIDRNMPRGGKTKPAYRFLQFLIIIKQF